jgi:hypothetical protein
MFLVDRSLYDCFINNDCYISKYQLSKNILIHAKFLGIFILEHMRINYERELINKVINKLADHIMLATRCLFFSDLKMNTTMHIKQVFTWLYRSKILPLVTK